MLFSKLLLPTLKDAPQEAEVVSHKLMLRSGMIRKVASGIYTWLPLGLKVLKKVENIVREEMDNSGAQEVFMPMVQPRDCLLYTSPSPRDGLLSRMPSSA